MLGSRPVIFLGAKETGLHIADALAYAQSEVMKFQIDPGEW
jgi:hypothetical protein